MASHATRQPQPQPEPQTPTQPPVDGDEQYDDTTTPVEPSQPTDG